MPEPYLIVEPPRCPEHHCKLVYICPECEKNARREQMEADCRIIEDTIREYEEFRQRGTAFRTDVVLRAVIHSIRKAAENKPIDPS